MNQVFDYATIGIRPDDETGEFVTVGVVVYATKTGDFDFALLGPHQFRRVKRMFPDFSQKLGDEVWLEMSRNLNFLKNTINEQLMFSRGGRHLIDEPLFQEGIFSSITTERSGLFMFPKKGRRMGENLGSVVDILRRRFLQGGERGTWAEVWMAKDLWELLDSEQILRFYRRGSRVGPPIYRVRFALAHLCEGGGDRAERVIQPLNLDLRDSTKIFNHADEWRQKLQRLERFGFRPEHCLVTYRAPQGGDAGRQEAFEQVREDFRKEAVELVEEHDHQGMLDFARIPEAVDLRLGN